MAGTPDSIWWSGDYLSWFPGMYPITEGRIIPFDAPEEPMGPDMPPRNTIEPGQTSPEFGIAQSQDLPGIIEWRVDVWTPTPEYDEDRDKGIYEDIYWENGRLIRIRHEYDPNTVDTATLPNYDSYPYILRGHTVGPELNPDDMSIEQQLFRLENLVREAATIGWIGGSAAERLVAEAQSARRKVSLGGEASAHSAAAWAKLMQMRDELRRAVAFWSDRVEVVDGLPIYDMIRESEADDRAWYLLEPNLRYLLDRLAPPRPPGRGSGPERR